MDRVFVDTGAFIALQNRSDQYNALAATFSRELIGKKVPLVTTNLVLTEVYTWLQRHPAAGYGAALFFHKWFAGLSSREADDMAELGLNMRRFPTASGGWKAVHLLYADASTEDAAWDFFTKLGASGATYTDCVSFAMMKSLGLKQAFTFDENFAEAGFQRVP